MSIVSSGGALRRPRARVVQLLLVVLALVAAVPSMAAASTFTISGKVTSLPGGSPLADVTIEILDAADGTVATTATDNSSGSSRGTYAVQVDEGTYRVRATPTSGGFRPATTQPYTVDRDTTVDIGLVRPGVSHVQGRFADRDGTALPSFGISVSNGSGTSAQAGIGLDGHYDLALLDGDYIAYLNGTFGPDNYFNIYDARLKVDGDSTRDIDLDEHEVTVRVIDEDGDVVPNARISGSLYGSATDPFGDGPNGYSFTSVSTTTGSDGTARFKALATTQSNQLSITPAAGSGLANTGLAVPSSAEDQVLTVVLRTPSHVQGRVSDRDGNPLASFGASAFDGGGTSAQAVTGPDGHYDLALLDGDYIAYVNGSFGPDNYFNVYDARLKVNGDSTRDIQFHEHRVTVRVVDEEGNLIPNTRINGSLYGSAIDPFGDGTNGYTFTSINTIASTGETVFRTLPTTQSNQLSITPPSSSGFANTGVSVPAATEDQTLTVVLRKPSHVQGRALDRDGHPLPSFGASVYDGGGTSAQADIGPNGRYDLALLDGDYTAYLNGTFGPDNYFNVYDARLKVRGDSTRDIQFGEHEVTVRVLDEDGNAVPNTRVSGNLYGSATDPFGDGPNGYAFTSVNTSTTPSGEARFKSLPTNQVNQLSITPPPGSGLANTGLPLPAITEDTTITLSYAGGAPSAIALTPTSYAFGDAPTGTTTAATQVKVTNVLGRPVTPSSVSVVGDDAADFQITGDACTGEELTELESCTLSVQFRPSSYGAKSAQLRIVDNGPGSPRRASLTGRGTDVVDPLAIISSPSDGQRIPQHAEVLAQYVCSDPFGGSGIESCTGDVANGAPIDTDDLGSHHVTVRAVDRAGNAHETTVTYLVVDQTDPTVTITRPTDGAAYDQGEIVHADYACADDGSGIDTCTGTVANGNAIDTATLGTHEFTVTARDREGNQSTKRVSYTVRDVTAPTIEITRPVDGTTYAQGSAVNAAYSCADESQGSGLDQCTGTVPNGSALDTTTLGSHPFTVEAVDQAGNRRERTVHYLVTDQTPPTITIRAPIDGQTLALGSTVNADYACTDAPGSGVASCAGTVANGQPVDTTTSGPHTFQVVGTDNAGNHRTEMVSYTVARADTRAPDITLVRPTQGAQYTRGSVVTASYRCVDDTDGEAVAECSGTKPSGAALDTAALGPHTFTVHAVDQAGNPSDVTVTYEVIDGTDPTVTITRPTSGAGYARGQAVTVAYACADEAGGSGISTCTGTLANGAALPTNTLGTFTFTVVATDRAGNRTSRSVSYTVTDQTAPGITITTPQQGLRYERGASVAASYTCADEAGGSGLASCVGNVPSGQPIDTATSGAKTFTVTAKDNAGNQSTKSVNYTVSDTTKPTATITSPSAAGYLWAGLLLNPLRVRYSCADNPGGSGIASCTATADGQPIADGALAPSSLTLLGLNKHVVVVTAVDREGNRSTTTAEYGVYVACVPFVVCV